MHSALIGILGLFIFAASFADAATIAGTVSGPDGTPLRAAFVQARHAKLKMTVSVLSDNAGRYLVENLPAGDYRLSVRAIGYKAEPKSGITLAAEQNLSHDFALQPAPVRSDAGAARRALPHRLHLHRQVRPRAGSAEIPDQR